MTGQDLLVRRKALRLSRDRLGRLLGVPANTLYRWEAGVMEMRHPELVEAALERVERAAAPIASRR